ncbi:MAG: isoprenyl transferase [candidate division KSB1 bacterium]|nr:isoprenyl transferase [candidate division KSB1 bacterium]
MPEELEEIRERIKRRGGLPRHVAIIMDGNGRWAIQRGLPRVAGHQEGINSVRAVVEGCGELGIQVLTLYTFSTENWRRPRSEVSALMRLLLKTIRTEVDELDRNNVRLMTIGHLEDLPPAARRGVTNTVQRLSKNTGLTVNLALSYGGRVEIVDAVRAMVAAALRGELKPEEINEQTVSRFLYTRDIPDPDLLIRTSGELRISNFLLWQLAYTEIYVTDVLWPDFRKREFFAAIEAYQRRERRFGRVSEQLVRG